MSIITVPVSKLVHSPLNNRQPGEFAPDSEYHSTGDLEAQILEFGLIHAPTVHPMPRGKYGVFIGGRRLLAFQRLIARGDLPKDHAIDCTVRDESGLVMTEMSFAENASRVAMPAVTEFQTYSRLIEEGADIAAVAHRYQVTELHVRQRMRLGKLHPEILVEVAAGRMTLDIAKAYAATTDQTLQKRVLDQRPTHAFEIRAAIKRDSVNAGVERMLGLVGMEAYVAAGGRAEEDFFSHGEVLVLDIAVLHRLYDARLDSERERLGLPAGVTLQFTIDGVGARIEDNAVLSDAQQDRLQAIDARIGVLEEYLDGVAEYDADGIMGRWVALAGTEQTTVDQFVAERAQLQSESEAIQGSSIATVGGPIVAFVGVQDHQLALRGYYRPAGWKPDTVSTSVTADRPHTQAERAARPGVGDGAAAPIEKPVVSGFRSDRAAYSGVYRQPEEVAREEYGLTKDGVDAMRSHNRQILQAGLLGDPIGVRLSHRFLIFVLARDMLRQRQDAEYMRAGDGELGVDRLPSRDFDPVHVRGELAGQPGASTVGDAVARLRAADWMTEPDVDVAFRRFSTAGVIDMERAAACVATAMFSRSLGIPGFVVPIHRTLAELINIDVRDHWTPDEAFFARLPKNRKLEALRFVDDAVAKRVASLSTEDLNQAAAAIMSGSRAAAEQFGLSREAAARAAGWVPDYLTLQDDDEPDDPSDSDAIDADEVAA